MNGSEGDTLAPHVKAVRKLADLGKCFLAVDAIVAAEDNRSLRELAKAISKSLARMDRPFAYRTPMGTADETQWLAHVAMRAQTAPPHVALPLLIALTEGGANRPSPALAVHFREQLQGLCSALKGSEDGQATLVAAAVKWPQGVHNDVVRQSLSDFPGTASELLVHALMDDSVRQAQPDTYAAASDLLVALQDVSASTLLAHLPAASGPFREALLDVLVRIDTDETRAAIIPKLTEQVLHDEGPGRDVAAGLLMRINHPAARAGLIEALPQLSMPRRRIKVIQTLRPSALSDAAVVTALCKCLDDPHPDVREAAFGALCDVGNAEVVAPLCAAMQDVRHGALAEPQDEVAVQRCLDFAERLAKVHHPQVTSVLEYMLADPIDGLCRAAASALAQRGHPHGRHFVLHALWSKHEDHHRWAIECILDAQKSTPGAFDRGVVVSAILERMGNNFLADATIVTLVPPDPTILRRTCQLATRAGPWELRRAAAHLLGRIGSRHDLRVVGTLIRALDDAQPSVAVAAGWSLKKLTRQSLPPQPSRWESWLRTRHDEAAIEAMWRMLDAIDLS